MTRGYKGRQETTERGLCLSDVLFALSFTSGKDLSEFSNYLLYFTYRMMASIRQHQPKKTLKYLILVSNLVSECRRRRFFFFFYCITPISTV